MFYWTFEIVEIPKFSQLIRAWGTQVTNSWTWMRVWIDKQRNRSERTCLNISLWKALKFIWKVIKFSFKEFLIIQYTVSRHTSSISDVANIAARKTWCLVRMGENAAHNSPRTDCCSSSVHFLLPTTSFRSSDPLDHSSNSFSSWKAASLSHTDTLFQAMRTLQNVSVQSSTVTAKAPRWKMRYDDDDNEPFVELPCWCGWENGSGCCS